LGGAHSIGKLIEEREPPLPSFSYFRISDMGEKKQNASFYRLADIFLV